MFGELSYAELALLSENETSMPHEQDARTGSAVKVLAIESLDSGQGSVGRSPNHVSSSAIFGMEMSCALALKQNNQGKEGQG